MAGKREKSYSLQMRKVLLVICEGKTEENYINLLRKWYKCPIKIISHIEGSKISPSLVEKRANELKISRNDNIQTYLVYDMDVQSINGKLIECKANLLLSNPCFELWLLLHAKEQVSKIGTDSVIHELRESSHIWQKYEKSKFSETQKTFLKNNIGIALDRAKRLKEKENPSTSIYKLVQKLKDGNI